MHAASVLAQARVPPAVAAARALAGMTALQKLDGCEGHSHGDVFRRLVSRALAKTWASTFHEATRPYQHPLSARTGMDALVARLCTALETDPVVVSLDGRSACHSETIPDNRRRHLWPTMLRDSLGPGSQLPKRIKLYMVFTDLHPCNLRSTGVDHGRDSGVFVHSCQRIPV